MKAILIILVLVATYFVQKEIRCYFFGFDTIEWQGVDFKLKRKFLDYEHYKNTINPLLDSEVKRVEKILGEIDFPNYISELNQLFEIKSGVRFPGYGSISNGSRLDENNIRYYEIGYEVPNTDRMRHIIYRLEGDKGDPIHKVKDTFIDWAEIPEYDEDKIENGKLIYLKSGNPVYEISFDA